MKKILFPIAALCLVSACSGEKSVPDAEAKVVDNSVEAVERDIAAGSVDPVTPSGKTVNLDAVKAAFAAACPDAAPVQNASCKAGAKPGEYACNYALKGDNVFNMKQVAIAEDGDNWKFVEAPNHCTAQ